MARRGALLTSLCATGADEGRASPVRRPAPIPRQGPPVLRNGIWFADDARQDTGRSSDSRGRPSPADVDACPHGIGWSILNPDTPRQYSAPIGRPRCLRGVDTFAKNSYRGESHDHSLSLPYRTLAAPVLRGCGSLTWRHRHYCSGRNGEPRRPALRSSARPAKQPSPSQPTHCSFRTKGATRFAVGDKCPRQYEGRARGAGSKRPRIRGGFRLPPHHPRESAIR